MTVRAPAPRPCASCPYRRDVPSGVWAASEYAKLPPYDGETFEQPMHLFLCHQHAAGDDGARLCGGWAGCHDTGHLLALRVAASNGTLSRDDLEATFEYSTDVPLFSSGAEAAEHGMREIEDASPEARRIIEKITRRRPDVRRG